VGWNFGRVCGWRAKHPIRKGSTLLSPSKKKGARSEKLRVVKTADFCLILTCALCHMLGMNRRVSSESLSDVTHWLRSEAANFCPALLGSLSLRRSRCGRKNCSACQSGKQHQNYVLYSTAHGRRVAVYVPEELVPDVQRTLDNGRALQDLLHQIAPRYIKALKRERRRLTDNQS
jgi:hypothetical protein